MNKKFSSLSIRHLVMLFCCPFIILTLLSCSYFFQTGKKQIANLIENNASAILEQTCDDLEQKINTFTSLPAAITTSSYYYKMRNNIADKNDVFTANDYYNFSNSIYTFLSMNANYIDSILFYLDDYSDTLYRSNSYSQLKKISYEFSDYKGSYTPYKMYWITDKTEPYPYSTHDNNISKNSLMEVFGSSDSDVHGILMFNMNDDLFTSSLVNCKITASSCVTLVKDGVIQFSSKELYGSDILEKLSTSDLNAISINAKHAAPNQSIAYELSDYYVIYRPLSLESMGALAVIPKDEMYLNSNHFSYAAIRFSIVVITICIVLYFMITYIFSRPISSLVTQLYYVADDHLDTHIHAGGGKEIYQICSSVNNLIDRMNLLMKNLEAEMNAKQMAELQTLYAQINPHFLYNALDCIGQLSDLGESKKVSLMINQLATFYRIGVSKGNVQITLQEELTHVEMYLSILKTRFEDFQYEIHCPPEYKNYAVIKLILQPIVENALYHGIRPYRMDGTVIINVKEESSDLIIAVSDDGGGIPDYKLDSIRQTLSQPSNQKQTVVYGLKNVHDRLRLTYGAGYGIHIQSTLEEGTIVTMRIPLPQDGLIADDSYQESEYTEESL